MKKISITDITLRRAAEDAGMNGHIAKPINVPAMLETLSKVLKGRQQKG